MTRCFTWLLLGSLVLTAGCSDRDKTVVDDDQMTAEQEAAQAAYVEEMDGPPPD